MDIVYNQRAVLSHPERLSRVQFSLDARAELIVDGGLRVQNAVLPT